MSKTTTFTVTVISCADENTFTQTAISPASPTYTIGSVATTISFAAWSTLYANCGPIVYTSKNSDTTALDAGLITFNGASSYTVSSNNVVYTGV